MAGWRAEVGMKYENKFAVEEQSVPLKLIGKGMSFNYKPNNNLNYVGGIGSKTVDFVSTGKFTGTFGFDVYLDYNNFFWLAGVFDTYEFDPADTSANPPKPAIHRFKITNTSRKPSFTVVATKRNTVVGGDFDIRTVLMGCVITSCKFNYETNSGSSIKCSVSGVYAREYSNVYSDGKLPEITYESNKILPIEFLCVKIDDGTEPIANLESTGWNFNTPSTNVLSCGTRFASERWDGAIGKIGLTMKSYSKDAYNYLRIYTGGEKPTLASGDKLQPMEKGLKPMLLVTVNSSYPLDGKEAKFTAFFENMYIESGQMNFTQNNEIVDDPTASATNMYIEIVSPEQETPYTNVPNLKDNTPKQITITFNANDGTTTPATKTQNVQAGIDVQLDANTFAYDGHTFTGWNTEANGTGTSYADETTVSFATNTTLYAQWDVTPTP